MSSYYDIPVIIPSYEPDEKLIALLHALQREGISHVVVVDDGSGAQYESFFYTGSGNGELYGAVPCSKSWQGQGAQDGV